MRVPIAMADAFTETPGEGNRAGIVLEGRTLHDGQMRAVARAIGASETAFMVSKADVSIRTLRFFTPREEVPFCGHATLAAVVRLAELGQLSVPGTGHVDTGAGRIALELQRTPSGQVHVWMEVPLPPSRSAPLSPEFVLELCRGRADMLEPRIPATAAGAQLFIPLRTRRDLFALAPRFEALADAGGAHGLRGFALFTRETIEPTSVAHVRYFAPSVGVREDPVTGSAAAPLARLLASLGALPLPEAGGIARATIEQGDALGRPGRIHVEVTGAPSAIQRVRVGGVAVVVIDGFVQA